MVSLNALRGATALAPWRWQARPWTIAALAWFGLWLLANATLPEGSRAVAHAIAWGRVPLLVAAIALGWQAARANRGNARAHAGWLLVTAGIAVLLPGDLVFGYRLLMLGEASSVSLGDAFYLLYFPLILGGLLAMPRVFRGRLDALKFTLDAATIALGGGMILWQFVAAPALAAHQGDPTPILIIDLAYPVGDLLTLLGIGAVLLRLPGGNWALSFLLLAGALIASLFGDVAFALASLYRKPGLQAVAYTLWALQPFFFIAAAEHEWRRVRTPRAQGEEAHWRPAFGVLPVVGLVLGYAAVAEAAWSQDVAHLRGMLPLAFALTLLVVLRQLIAQRENVVLLAEQVHRAGEARFAALVEHASDAILILDAALAISFASPAAQKLLRAGAGTDATSFAAHLHPDDADALREYAAACSRGQIAHGMMELRFGHEPGPWLVAEASVTNMLADPKVRGLVLNVRDVSDRRALQEQLREQALRDPLTGLANRALFVDRVASTITRCESGTGGFAVAVLDLDRFKLVNDGLGHRVGDQVLAQIAGRIAGAVGRADSAARLGGDEFGILLEDAGSADSVRERVDRVRAAAAQPVRVDGHVVRLTATAGIALGAGVDSTEALLRNADIALQQGRAEGGDTSELFRSDRHGRVVERLALEAELPRLLERDAFCVQFEPFVRVADGWQAGLIVRLGWRDPTNAPATLSAVLLAARESSASVPLGRWLRQTAQRDLAALLHYLPESADLDIVLGLEAPQLRDDALRDDLAAMLARLELSPRKLILVPSESALLPLTGVAAMALARLRELGVRCALGEFGAAHAAFELLDAFRFDALVLAESLVERVEVGERPGALVRAAIATARSIGLDVLAPGVRTARQLALLAELDCDFACGPQIALPMGFERILPWLGSRFAEPTPAVMR